MRLRTRLLFYLFFALVATLALNALTSKFFDQERVIVLAPEKEVVPISSQTAIQVIVSSTSSEPLIIFGTSTQVSVREPVRAKIYSDIEPQAPLGSPPAQIKAIYATGWSAGNPKKIKYFIDLIKTTELNAIVIDIKDFSGYVLYNTELKEVRDYNGVEVRIPRLNALIKQFHDEGIYVIARIAVFQDPRLALARRDLALQSARAQSVWKDKLGLAWIDPAARESWDYNIAIAKEALGRGFDEINFDYIRFASDGDLSDIIYPVWDKKISRREVIKNFFAYLRSELPEARISADLFGLVTVAQDDLGIGQLLETALPYFDYIAPMVYPSHYESGFLNFKNPAKFPYQVIVHSLTTAISRFGNYEKNYLALSQSTTTPPDKIPREPIAKFRPWLQDFDLGADYNAEMVKKEIQAVYDGASTTPELLDGWMLWNPANVYTKGALLEEPLATGN